MILDKHPHGGNLDRFVSSAKVRFLGYWGGQVTQDHWTNPDENKGLPNPQDFVDESWDPVARAKVVGYLKAGKEWVAWRGPSWCRFRCGERSMGSRCLTDGYFVWPEGFAHYVQKHGVKPHPDFLKHLGLE